MLPDITSFETCPQATESENAHGLSRVPARSRPLLLFVTVGVGLEFDCIQTVSLHLKMRLRLTLRSTIYIRPNWSVNENEI